MGRGDKTILFPPYECRQLKLGRSLEVNLQVNKREERQCEWISSECSSGFLLE